MLKPVSANPFRDFTSGKCDTQSGDYQGTFRSVQANCCSMSQWHHIAACFPHKLISRAHATSTIQVMWLILLHCFHTLKSYWPPWEEVVHYHARPKKEMLLLQVFPVWTCWVRTCISMLHLNTTLQLFSQFWHLCSGELISGETAKCNDVKWPASHTCPSIQNKLFKIHLNPTISQWESQAVTQIWWFLH